MREYHMVITKPTVKILTPHTLFTWGIFCCEFFLWEVEKCISCLSSSQQYYTVLCIRLRPLSKYNWLMAVLILVGKAIEARKRMRGRTCTSTMSSWFNSTCRVVVPANPCLRTWNSFGQRWSYVHVKQPNGGSHGFTWAQAHLSHLPLLTVKEEPFF